MVVLIIGFILFFGTRSNAEDIKEQCNVACISNSVAGYCDLPRNLIASDLPNDLESKSGTCDFFSTSKEYLKYGINKCEKIKCHEVIDQTCVTGIKGSWETPQADGSCAQKGEFLRRKVTPSDNPPEPGMICCV